MKNTRKLKLKKILERKSYSTSELLENISLIILKNTHINAKIYKNLLDSENYEMINYYVNFIIKQIIEFFIDKLSIPISHFSYNLKNIDYSIIDRIDKEIKIIFLNFKKSQVLNRINIDNIRLTIDEVNIIFDSIEIDKEKCYFETRNYIMDIIRKHKY